MSTSSTTRRTDPRLLIARLAPQLLLAFLVVALAIVQPSVLSPDNLTNVLINTVPIALLALGAMWVLIGGGLDLSAGYGVAMSAMVCGAQLQSGASMLVAVASAVAAGLALGLVNGLLVGIVGMPAFIATLATMVSVQGITLVLGGVGTVIVTDQALGYIGTGGIGPIPVLVILLVAVAAVVYYMSRFTRFGLHTYAIGSGRDESHARGIKVVRLDLMIYLFAGLMTALTAVVLVARVQIVDPRIAGLDLLLDAFAATILGGTSLFGGRGSVVGTLTGAVFIGLMTTSMVSLGVGPQNVQLLKGVLIVTAVVVDAAVRALEQRALTAVTQA